MHLKINLKIKCLLELFVKAAVALLIVYLILPHRFASHYNDIIAKNIEGLLLDEVTQNISEQTVNSCDYSEVIADNTYIYTQRYRERVLSVEEIQPGGEYYPEDCRARYSTAIIVPYRQRENHLHAFVTYMHNFLRKQRIHYRIFLIEQYDQKPFNRAKLFNIGAVIAGKEYGFPCLILHDVDLLPLNAGQIYGCTKLARHMCSALDVFRFNLPYGGLFGGVVAISSEQYTKINGMSNLYEGWGGEDDDLFVRLEKHNIGICRFEPAYSEYTMLRHKPEQPNPGRYKLLWASQSRLDTDGLNSLVYEEEQRRIHSLFTHILVKT